MDAALGTLNQAQQLAKSLSDAVATAQAELAQIQAQKHCWNPLSGSAAVRVADERPGRDSSGITAKYSNQQRTELYPDLRREQ